MTDPRLTRWSYRPDTCECDIVIEGIAGMEWWQFIPVELRRVCIHHARFADLQELHKVLQHEQHLKNGALYQELVKLAPSIGKANSEQSPIRVLPESEAKLERRKYPKKAKHVLGWWFNDRRKLRLEIPSTFPIDRDKAQSLLDARFGEGLIRVNAARGMNV